MIAIKPKKKMATSSILQEPPDDDGGYDEGEGKVHVCLPVENLLEDGVAPQEGDTVEVNISGDVYKVEGGLAYIDPKEVNGQPLANDGQGPDHQTNDEDEDDIDRKAGPMLAARDQEMYGA